MHALGRESLSVMTKTYRLTGASLAAGEAKAAQNRQISRARPQVAPSVLDLLLHPPMAEIKYAG